MLIQLLCHFNSIAIASITMLLQWPFFDTFVRFQILRSLLKNDNYNRYFRLLHVNSIIFILISGLSSFAFPSAFVSRNFREHETID